MSTQEITKNGSEIIFSPLTLTSINSQSIKEAFIAQLEGCTNITINLGKTTNFDISGLQIIKSIQNYCELNGCPINIINISDIVDTKLTMMGASL